MLQAMGLSLPLKGDSPGKHTETEMSQRSLQNRPTTSCESFNGVWYHILYGWVREIIAKEDNSRQGFYMFRGNM